MSATEEGTSSHVSTSSELLNPHGVRWAEQSEISIDYDQGTHPNLELMWAAGTPPFGQRTPFHYFSLMFPMDDANEWITKTSSALANLHCRARTESESFHFWGLIQAISLGSEPNRQNYWIEEYDTDSKQVYPPHSFGIRCFEDILHCLSFGDTDPNDRWSSELPFLIAINKRKQSIIIPSRINIIDELMSSWVSRKQDHTKDGIPHLTKIIRKPKGVGAEVKCLAHGVVGIMLRMEICEGKDAEAEKKWSYLPAGTAQTLRLSEFWHGSQRIIVGDSAFSSVNNCHSMPKERPLL